MKTKYTIFRKRNTGWVEDFSNIQTLRQVKMIVDMSIALGWAKNKHKIVKTEYSETNIPLTFIKK